MNVLKPWDQLTAEEKKLFIRQVEVFAAYAAYNDHEIGRVIQAFEDLGRLDNTLIIYINGDNGTSAEGGPLGTPNEVAFFNGVNKMPVDVQMKWYDVWGTEQTYNHMSAGWSWAFDTPFDWFKQNASRLGGINQNMVVSWPARIKDKGGLARAVHPRDRRRADHPRGRRHPRARDGRRHQAGADRGHQLRLHLRRGERQGAVTPQDPVLRDDGPVGALRRRLAPEHQGQPRTLGGLRRGQPRSAEQPGVPALRPDQGLQPVQRHRRGASGEGRGDAEEVRRGGEEVPGLPAGRLGGGPHRRAAPEHHRRPHRVRLHPADGRAAAGRLAVPAQQPPTPSPRTSRCRKAVPRA